MLWQVKIINDRFKNLEMDLFLVFCLFVNMCYVNYGVFLKKKFCPFVVHVCYPQVPTLHIVSYFAGTLMRLWAYINPY